MADIFVSYAHQDRKWAEGFAHSLEAKGFSVWWDRNILPTRPFRTVIREELQAASIVIAVWSTVLVDSEWVLDEAEDAKRNGKLVSVFKEPVALPDGFGQRQAVDLSAWRAGEDETEFGRLVESLRAIRPLGPAKTAIAPNTPAPSGSSPRDAEPADGPFAGSRLAVAGPVRAHRHRRIPQAHLQHADAPLSGFQRACEPAGILVLHRSHDGTEAGGRSHRRDADQWNHCKRRKSCTAHANKRHGCATIAGCRHKRGVRLDLGGSRSHQLRSLAVAISWLAAIGFPVFAVMPVADPLIALTALVLLFMCALRGSVGRNRYGPPPPLLPGG